MLRAITIVALAIAAFSDAAAAQQTSGPVEIEGPAGARKSINPDWQNINARPLGTPGNPVRAQGVAGGRTYVDRLRCANGSLAPQVRRIGTGGVGPYTMAVDTYEIECDGDLFVVYLDRHHPGHIERRPVPRFTIRAP